MFRAIRLLRRIRTGPLTLTALVCLPAAQAQMPLPAAPQIPVLSTHTTLVLVPALVRTKTGAPVFTLKAEDFVLTDDGVEQKTTIEEDTGSEPLALVIVVELLGVRSLTFAVGAYLSIATTLAIFVGGVMRWMVDRAMVQHRERARRAANPDAIDPATGLPVPTSVTPTLDSESEISPGSLYASGLIAAGGIVGLLGVGARLLEGLSEQHGGHWQLFRFSEANPLHHDWVSVVMFALLAFSLYFFARKPLAGQKQR